MGSHLQMAAEVLPGRGTDPGTGGHRRGAGVDPGGAAGYRPGFEALVCAVPALRLHLLFPRDAAAGATVPGVLRPGAVRRDSRELYVALPAHPVLVSDGAHDAPPNPDF